MKTIVICPDRRPGVAFLARKTPLALVPVLGPTLLAHWLTALAERGAKEVVVLASDRPDQIRTVVGRGELWGLKIEVRAEPGEASIAKARLRFNTRAAGWLAAPFDVVVADQLPELPGGRLFADAAGFFGALKAWQPLAGKQRVGAREIAPGIWLGLRCKIDPSAKLIAPCWLGEDVWVRHCATVGPDTFIEDSAMVDNDVDITSSWAGPHTYVGSLTQVRDSLVWADGLLNHTTGSFTEVVDAFLLGDLRGQRGFTRSSSWWGRLAALAAAFFTSPVLLVAWLKNHGGHNLVSKRQAVIPTAVAGTTSLREMNYYELNGVAGLWRRWPQIWSIVRGDFTWVGNRPLTRAQAARLETEFEQLWLAAPVGLVSLADTFGGGGTCNDETRAHSSFYAVRSDRRLDREILRQLFLGAFQRR
jgi:hypothetical protein